MPRADKIRVVHPNDCPIVSQGHHGIIDDEENVNEGTNKIATEKERDRVAPPLIRA